MNIHLLDVIKRRLFLQAVVNLKLVLCGVVESWLKNSRAVMDAELVNTEWTWFGLDRKRRRGGGLGFVVKKSLKPRVMEVCECNNILWLELNSGSSLWYVALVYLIPKDPGGEVNGLTISELQRTIVDFNGKGKVVVMGDFNSRVGELPNILDSKWSNEDTVIPRSSEDTEVNGAGRRILEGMNAVGMVLLNGVGERARLTFQALSGRGESMIDFIWAHCDELKDVAALEVVNEEKYRLSDHFLVIVSILSPFKAVDITPLQNGSEMRVRWNTLSKGRSDHWKTLRELGDTHMGSWRPHGSGGIDDSKSVAEEVWSSWLSRMRSTVELGLGFAQTRKTRPFGHDGQLARLLEQRNAVRRRRMEQKDDVKRATLQVELRELQKKVKTRLSLLRSQSINSRNAVLLKCKSRNPSVYWEVLKRTVGLNRKKVQIPSEVLFNGVVTCGDKIREVWGEAFRRIFAVDKEEKTFREEWLEEIRQEVGSEVKLSYQFDSLNVELNQPISEEEVLNVIANLRQGKAAGIDSLVNEILKFGGDGIGRATAKLCQFMFSCERVPKDWARGLIFPLYKDGDARNPDNYRGITLLSVVGKVYASVLNARVMKWCERYGVLSEEQAGFRAGRSTVDHIFSVAEVLRLRRNQKKETHCAFLDIKKAYDTVHRDGLWMRLLDVGIRGKMWRVLKNLYDVVESSVLVGKQRSEWFAVEAGVRQGCILSPILFAIWIDGLARALKRAKVKSVIQDINFNFTFFADDIALLADSREDLQKLLDTAFNYSECWRFKWNCNKSKIMRFGCKGKKLPYFLGLEELEVVKLFKFLGVDLQQNLAWTATKLRFAAKARSRLPMLKKAMIEGISVESGVKLWETLIRPTLEYAAEVWSEGDWTEADRIQNAAGRTLLGLYKSTSVEVARGELGWLSLRARREIRLLSYWGKLVKMDDSRLVKQIFRYCKDRTSTLRGSFCYAVRKLLMTLGLEQLWRSEQIGERKDWELRARKSIRLKDKFCWLANLHDKPKLRTYELLNFKTDWCKEEYLSWEITADQRVLYARLRSGSHQLRIETGRWDHEQEAKRVCIVCGTGKIENEKHFLLDCYAYERCRRIMFNRILQETGFDLASMKEDPDWLLEVLIGDGLPNRETRHSIGKAVATFLEVATRMRAQILRT